MSGKLVIIDGNRILDSKITCLCQMRDKHISKYESKIIYQKAPLANIKHIGVKFDKNRLQFSEFTQRTEREISLV